MGNAVADTAVVYSYRVIQRAKNQFDWQLSVRPFRVKTKFTEEAFKRTVSDLANTIKVVLSFYAAGTKAVRFVAHK